MRLSDVLSHSKNEAFVQVEGFLDGRKLKCGKQKKIAVGRIAASYHCKQCEDDLTFVSSDELYCIGVNDHLVSIDCVVSCSRCGNALPVWFLVESQNDMYDRVPCVRILSQKEQLTSTIILSTSSTYGQYSDLLTKADYAFQNGLGAGSMVYLRKIFEGVVYQTATAAGIDILQPNQKRKPFKQILEMVEEQCDIIPSEFENDAYRLFGELSGSVHGENEVTEIRNFHALRRLVVGVLDRVKNNQELMEAIGVLGWNDNSEETA